MKTGIQDTGSAYFLPLIILLEITIEFKALSEPVMEI